VQSYLNPPLRPRNGQTLEVLGIARISTLNQDERSLADQEAMLRRWLLRNYGKSFDLRMITSQGSGERLDRTESVEATRLVESRKFDLVLSEDLARIFRRMHAYLFCETCEDYGTRLIAINDNVDTAKSDWRMAAIFQAFKHEASNKDTSERIKRTLRNRFSQGGVFQVPIYGYIKKEDAKGEEDVEKNPKAEMVYEEWFTRLEGGASYAEVADWLNEAGIPVGPYCRDKEWTGPMVRRVTFNPILKGVRERNRKMTVRNNQTGRHVSVDAAPEELLTRECKHLAFIEPARYDRVIRLLRARNSKYSRGRKMGIDSRKGVPRKRTVWPGQAVLCGVCGRPYYWGGHGQTQHMMCSGARDWKCWNGVTFDGVQGASLLCKAILDQIEVLPNFDPTFLAMVRQDLIEGVACSEQELAHLTGELEAVKAKARRVQDSIAETENVRRRQALGEKLDELLAEEDRLAEQIALLNNQPRQDATLPSLEEIKREAREVIGMLANNSPEFGRRIRRLVPSITVVPYRLIDGGNVVLRAKLTLKLTSLMEDWAGLATHEKLQQHYRHDLTVDLFDQPQRVKFAEQVVNLRADGQTEKQVAVKLGLTVTAAQRAAALRRLMDEQGATDPYALIKEPPAGCTKLRRHLHPRYSFEPLPGYPAW
jgi:DNA invertase Pin-like site-specific DNA recombinase